METDMNARVFWAAFVMIFMMEMGDKTQVAALALAAREQRPVAVFLGAVSAFAVATALAVIVGKAAGALLPERAVRYAAGAVFMVFGALLLAGRV